VILAPADEDDRMIGSPAPTGDKWDEFARAPSQNCDSRVHWFDPDNLGRDRSGHASRGRIDPTVAGWGSPASEHVIWSGRMDLRPR
jgi:hypothetical protein